MLSINNLVAGYGKLHILHGVNLSVAQGQFVGIIGPNGSGKSTLVKSVFGLATIFEGEILFEGQALQDLPIEAISRCGLAYVPQMCNVFTPMTVREHLQLALRHRPKADTQSALAEAFELFPILRERGRQRAGQMSGGERQMLAIAMAWLAHPKLMLLDEPSAGLSPLIMSEVFRKLRELCTRGLSLVVVEQNARSLLRACDYAYVLHEGQIVLQDAAQEIMADEATVKNYLSV